MTKPTNSPIDITNQKFGVMGSPADTTYLLRVITIGNIPVIRKFIDSNSGANVFFNAREPEGENHEDGSCCCHSCDGDRSPRSGEGEAGAIGAPARLSVVGPTRLLPRLPSEGL